MMISSTFRDPRASRHPCRGLSLFEVILCTIIVGSAITPMLVITSTRLRDSKTNGRHAVAESLVRESIEYLKWRKQNNGFNWLWNRAGTTVSGISNPSGSAANQQLDRKMRGGGASYDPAADVFDRRVQIIRRVQTVNGATVRYVEVNVSIINDQDPMLRPPPSGPPIFTIKTFIGETPGS